MLGWSISSVPGILSSMFPPPTTTTTTNLRVPIFGIAWLLSCVKMGMPVVEFDTKETIFHVMASLLATLPDGMSHLGIANLKFCPAGSEPDLVLGLRELVKLGRAAGLKFTTPNAEGETPLQRLLACCRGTTTTSLSELLACEKLFSPTEMKMYNAEIKKINSS
jgi:hypothetical protein